tara:strand:- start:377 stop:589 length:213 start_codon:yes stop_codon:yes gene_type:complete
LEVIAPLVVEPFMVEMEQELSLVFVIILSSQPLVLLLLLVEQGSWIPRKLLQSFLFLLKECEQFFDHNLF